ncbi:MAG: hypothetical protein FD129_3341 [bacterium]|nr:MAG: hypothetical protein FD129_3341 [bacterium]
MTPRTGHFRKAQATVEFAIVLPFLLLILAAIIEFGFYFCDLIGTTCGVRTGTLAAIQLTPDGSSRYSDFDIYVMVNSAHGPVCLTVSIRHAHAFIFSDLLPVAALSVIRSSMRAEALVTSL